MKGDAVVHLTSCDKTIIASAKIARFLAKELDCPIIDQGFKARFLERPARLFVVNGPFSYCDFRNKLIELVRTADTVVWVQNDYMVREVQRFKRRDIRIWTTIPHLVKKATDAYVNWNRITYETFPAGGQRLPGLFYWGSYRPGREAYFKRYLGSAATYPVHISAPAAAAKKFWRVNHRAMIHPPFHSADFLASFQSTLYIEDEYSHKHYCSPASRFYEALGAGLAIAFEESSVANMAQAGYDVRPFVVSGAEGMAQFTKDYVGIAKAQAAWARDYIGDLRSDVKSLVNGLPR